MIRTAELPPLTKEQRHLRAKYAALTSCGRHDEAAIYAQEFRVERLADHITAIVTAAPPLTLAQRDRLRNLVDSAPAEAA